MNEIEELEKQLELVQQKIVVERSADDGLGHQLQSLWRDRDRLIAHIKRLKATLEPRKA